MSWGVGLCRHSIRSSTVEFQNETAIALLIPAKSIKSKISNWLAQKQEVRISINSEMIQMGLQSILQNRSFLNGLPKHFKLSQAHTEFLINSVEYSIVSGSTPNSVLVEVKVELNHVRMKLDHPEVSILGFDVPLFFLKRLRIPKSHSTFLETKLELQFSDQGEILNTRSTNSEIAFYLKSQWNRNVYPHILKSPLKISTFDVNSDGDISIGAGFHDAISKHNKSCKITCENFDFALALNSATLPQLVNELSKQPYIQKKIKTALPNIELVNTPRIRFLNSIDSKNLNFELDLQLRPLPLHALSQFVNQEFTIHLKLQFNVAVDNNGQGLKIHMGHLQPHSIQFSETHFKRPLQVLAAFTPEFIKAKLHNQILAIIENEVRLNLKPIILKNLKFPGLPHELPDLRLVAVGLDPEQNHPYFAFQIVD